MKTILSVKKTVFTSQNMIKVLYLLQIIFLSFVVANSAFSANADGIPKKKQTTLGLYYTPAQAYEQMQKHGDRTLFIDVRDPIEVNYTGMPRIADANVPFKFADRTKFNVKKKQFNMIANKTFVADIAARLTAKGLSKSDTVILMCRSGVRSGKAANALAKAGYTKVYSLTEGFEGDSIKKGANKGQRTINGWKNAGLPWDTPKALDISKMYGKPKPVGLKKK